MEVRILLLPRYSPDWATFRRTFVSLNRQAELARLIAWAKRKRLSGPLALYTRHLSDEQVRCAHYALRCHRTAKLAYVVHTLTSPLRPRPVYLRPGAAAGNKVRVACPPITMGYTDLQV